ncbi:14364_t:CDS:2 [Funneliformis mosseae]|uniref:14364_t:CDS:1 n=1 Tax=Funneliformis mosseae TaxID=27381 RepID=A0A9N9FZ72_FUNMO|nr:14364_t:CDS:2 [Funneliformis mosseae]
MELEQDNNSIEDFYEKHKKLSSANQLKARLCRLNMPLNELVDRLFKLEVLERHFS